MKIVLALLLGLAACNVGEIVLPDAPAAHPDAPSDAPGAVLAVTPTMHDYGGVPVGATSGAVGFTISTGSTTGVLAVSITGAGATDFAIVGGNCEGLVLTPQSPCTIFVALRPSSIGASAAQLQVNSTPGGTIGVPLSGTGTQPAQLQSITPSTFSFGNIAAGGASTAKRFTVTNIGTSSVGPMTALLTGTDASELEIIPLGDTCSNHANAPGASCTIDVRFVPTSVGPKTASLAISPLANATIAALSGTGVASAVLAITPSSKDFGVIPTGSSSVNVPFTVRNMGLAASSSLTTGISASTTGEFVILSASDTCAGATLAPNATCTVSVRFAPNALGVRTAQLDVGEGGAPASASLSGMGVFLDGVTFGPNPHAFGGITMGSTSQPQTFTITNGGFFTTGAFAVSLGGFDPGQFRIVAGTDHCSGVAVAPGTSCSIGVVFAPTSTGSKSASLQANAAPGGSFVASLGGIGVAPRLQISPESWDFGAVGVGFPTSWVPHTFTITNPSTVTASAVTTALNGSNLTEFEIVPGSDTCAGASLGPAATCSVRVRCAPMSTGPKVALLTVGGAPVVAAEAGLSCSAVSIHSLSVNPSILAFTNVGVGTTSAPQTFTVSNQGPVTIPSLSLTLIGAAANQYAIDPTSPCIGASLPAGDSCITTVRFLPTSVGTKNASVQVMAVPGGTVTVALNGTAVP